MFSTLTIIRIHHVRMICEGSRDTKNWSNDAENSALIIGINYILEHIEIESDKSFIIIIFHNNTIFSVFI